MSNALSQLSYYKQNFSFCRELNISVCPVSQNSEHVSRGWEADETEPQKVKPALTGWSGCLISFWRAILGPGTWDRIVHHKGHGLSWEDGFGGLL